MPIDVPAALAAARERAAAIDERRRAQLAETAGRPSWRQRAAFDAERAGLLAQLGGDPCDASPAVPLVLLPVRVQTRLAADGRTLRVRITPDEIHVDALARRLSDAERDAGRAYWRARWRDDGDAQAWPALQAAVGERRAGWVAHATRPVEPPGTDDTGGAEPVFGEDPPAAALGSVARLLPDRFVVRAYPHGHEPVTRVGAPVPRELPLAPIALSNEEFVDAAGLKLPAGSEWTVDFARALDVGMGVELPLPAGVEQLDCLVVTGIRQSVSEARNAAELADLLTGHRYADGLGTLPFGTPTNNASAERSPYRPDEPLPPPQRQPAGPSPDVAAMAGLLGLAPATLADLLGGDSASPTALDAAQQAANTALWYATWSTAFDRVEETATPGVTPAAIESARRLHRDAVRGAGHCPALRVGAQPYGILPVTALAAWKPRGGETTAPLVPLLQRLLARWVARARRLPRVGPGDDVTDEAMLEMLGMQPACSAVRVRPAVDGARLSPLAAATGAAAARVAGERRVGAAILSQYSVELARRFVAPSLHDRSRLVALPLVSARDAEVVAEILAGRRPKADSVLQALLEVAWDTAKQLVGRAAPAKTVSPLAALVGVSTEVAGWARAAAEDQPAEAPPPALREAAATLRAQRRFDGQPAEVPSLAAIEPVAEARTSLGQVALDLGDTAQARWVGQHALADLLELFAARIEVGAAMRALAAVPLDERRIAVACALDLASHRLDAWVTGIAADRQRRLAAADGVTIGAFGYVEDVRLGAGAPQPQGWLHAPSGAHAVAAGMLASAHRSNIGAQEERQPFAIDLGSRRGAALRRILEGMRAGQTIGALLGYQIERALTGPAARLQLSLREIAPLEPDTLGTELPVGERSARVAAAAVVDGAELLRRFPADRLADGALRDALSRPPVNAYVPAGGWDAVGEDEWATVVAALTEAAATLDAVSDALLAESVLQYAAGNPSRAATAMDGSAGRSSVDPDLGVLGVRQTTRTLTHAAFALIPDGASGWSATRPRAIAEPRLEAWAAARLGPAADVVVGVGPDGPLTLADAGLAALDLVFADDLSALEQELRSALPALGAAPLAIARDPAWPAAARAVAEIATLAGSLRAMAAGATPLAPAALVPPGDEPQHRPDLDELLGRCDALIVALDAALDAASEAVARIDPVSGAVDEAEVDAVRAALAPLAAFGVALTPDPALPTNASWALGAWQSAAARREDAAARLDAIRDPAAGLPTERAVLDAATAIGETLLGDGFRLLPLLRRQAADAAAAADDFARAWHEPAFPAPRPSQLSAFVRDHATVRAGIARLAEAQLIGRALGRPTTLHAVQLGARAGDGTPEPGSDRWLAGPLADDRPWPSRPASHLIVELVGEAADATDAVAGLMFDGWVEALPFRPDARAFAPEAVENPSRAHRATTSLAVQARQASAHAPQAILSAVPADDARWGTDSVIETIRSAFAVAQARLVSHETLPGDAAVLPAIHVASPWLQPGKGLHFAELATLDWSRLPYPFLSEQA